MSWIQMKIHLTFILRAHYFYREYSVPFIQGSFNNIHKEVINLLEVWATDLCDHCCIKSDSDSSEQGSVIIKGRLEETNSLLHKLNDWLEKIHFNKNILEPHQRALSKFEALVNCLIEQVPKGSREFNMETETLLITFEKLKKAFA